MAEGGEVLLHLGAGNRAWNDRGHNWVAKRELERRRGERDGVALADRLDMSHSLQNRLRGGCVVVHGARNGAGRENAGIVAAPMTIPTPRSAHLGNSSSSTS